MASEGLGECQRHEADMQIEGVNIGYKRWKRHKHNSGFCVNVNAISCTYTHTQRERERESASAAGAAVCSKRRTSHTHMWFRGDLSETPTRLWDPSQPRDGSTVDGAGPGAQQDNS